MYELCRILPEQLDRFAHLALTNLWPTLHAPQFINIGVSLSGMPVGLVCAELKRDYTADLRSIVVARESRRKGVATLLLRTIEQTLSDCGCAGVSVTYASSGGPHPAIEHLLQKTGWRPLEARGILCKTDYASLSQAEWMKHKSFPPGYDCHLLSALPENSRSRIIQSQAVQPWFPDVLNPFVDEEDIETKTSLAITHGDEVVGWCVCHRVSEFATQCKSLFVRKELQNRGLAITLLVRTIELGRVLRHQSFFFDVAFDKVKMIRFVERRMLPYLQSVRTIYRSRKSLITNRIVAEAQREQVS